MKAFRAFLVSISLVFIGLASGDVEPWCGIAGISSSGDLCDQAAVLVIDHLPGTAWFSGQQGALEIELSRESTISGVSIAWRRGEERVESFQVLASVDGQTWNYESEVLESSGQTLDLEFYPLDPTPARFVRIEALGNHTATATSIAEVRVHGVEKTNAWWVNSPIAHLVGEWRDASKIGWISTRHAPWIWHAEIGWFYTEASSDADIWLWLPGAHWAWSSADVFPCLFVADSSAWFYLAVFDGVVWYFDYASGEWTTTLP